MGGILPTEGSVFSGFLILTTNDCFFCNKLQPAATIRGCHPANLKHSMTLTTAENLFDPLEAMPAHDTWLRTALFSRLGNQHEVEEVMQEVAVAAASRSAKFVAVEKTGPWLYRVAIRQMLLFRRKAGRQRKLIRGVAELQGRGECDSRAHSPLEFLLNAERQQAVRHALGKMAERDRQLLLMKYVEGLSYNQIAECLGVSPSVIQSRLHRARAILRERLVRVVGNSELRK